MEQATPAPVTPMEIFITFNAYHHSAALKAGIEIDVFTKIAEGNTTAESIAGA